MGTTGLPPRLSSMTVGDSAVLMITRNCRKRMDDTLSALAIYPHVTNNKVVPIRDRFGNTVTPFCPAESVPRRRTYIFPVTPHESQSVTKCDIGGFFFGIPRCHTGMSHLVTHIFGNIVRFLRKIRDRHARKSEFVRTDALRSYASLGV